jgi:hypothetical protein
MTAFLAPDGWRRSPLRLLLFAIPAALLVTPAVAMRFTPEVQWTALDFVIAAVLLFGAAGTVDLAMRSSGSWPYRLGTGLAVLISFLLVWINGAVGIIGSEDNPANLLFIAIVVGTVAGSVFAGFRPRGMALTTGLAAAATAGIAVVVLILGWGAHEPPGLVGVVALIAVFAAMWLLASGLFAKAARDS